MKPSCEQTKVPPTIVIMANERMDLPFQDTQKLLNKPSSSVIRKRSSKRECCGHAVEGDLHLHWHGRLLDLPKYASVAAIK